MPGVIYDTAIIAALVDDTGISRFPNQVKLVLDSQLSDGSWGAHYYNSYDRLLSTVAVLNMIQKLKLNNDPSIRDQFQEGVTWIEENYDPKFNYNVPMPVGFEFLFPSLASKIMAQSPDLTINLSSIEASKERKLEILGDAIYSVPTPLLFSAEGVIENRDQAKKIAAFQSPNGSIGTSPAATSIIIEHDIKDKLPHAMRYLQQSIAPDGLFVHFNDYQHMNIAFSLYPLIKAEHQFGVQALHTGKQLNEGWSEHGVAFGKSFLNADADDTSMVLLDLKFLGHDIDPDRMDILLQYEKDTHFSTYFAEVSPALMTNIHVLEAFLKIDHPQSQQVVKKLTRFITDNQSNLLNISKYNSSVLIQQSSLILSLLPQLPEITATLITTVEDLALQYMNNTHEITVEETAHTLLALLYAMKHKLQVDKGIIRRLYQLLTAKLTGIYEFNETYTWSAKVQYSPTQISQAHVIAAQMLYHKLM